MVTKHCVPNNSRAFRTTPLTDDMTSDSDLFKSRFGLISFFEMGLWHLFFLHSGKAESTIIDSMHVKMLVVKTHMLFSTARALNLDRRSRFIALSLNFESRMTVTSWKSNTILIIKLKKNKIKCIYVSEYKNSRFKLLIKNIKTKTK